MDSKKWTSHHPGPEWLSAYEDRELDPASAREVEAHLEHCPSCQAVLEKIGAVDRLGAVLREDLPGEAFWNGLEARIRSRIREEAASPALLPEEALPTGEPETIVPVRPGPSEAGEPWWTRWFGRGPSLRWGLAMAGGLAVVILTSRLVMVQMGTPVDRQLARREAAGSPSEEPALSANQAAPAGEDNATAPSLTPSSSHDVVNLPPSLDRAPTGTLRSAAPGGAEGVTRPDAAAASSQLARKTGGETRETPAGEPVVPGARSQDKMLEAAQATPPPPANPTGGAPVDQASAPEAGPRQESQGFAAAPAPAAGGVEALSAAPESAVEPSPTAGLSRTAPSAVSDALAYAALVDLQLRGDQSKKGSDEIVAPQGLREKMATSAGRLLKRGVTTRLEDYQIAYAAAMRALESGRPDLARQGFSIVAHGVPETEMARDAEYNERLAQFRVRELQGDDREVLLREYQGLADRAWDRSQELRDRSTCRNALAYERLRVTLLQDMRPGADLGPFRERIDILKACS